MIYNNEWTSKCTMPRAETCFNLKVTDMATLSAILTADPLKDTTGKLSNNYTDSIL